MTKQSHRFTGRSGLDQHRRQRPGRACPLEATVYWQRASGRLWWRRWRAPQQCADVYTLSNGNYSESFGQDPELAEAARQWASGHFEGDDGRQYRVTWLSTEESVRAAARVFGFDIPAQRRRRGETRDAGD